MAIYRQVNHSSDKNAAAIVTSTGFGVRYRVRMADDKRHRFGAWNAGRLHNKSKAEVRIHFTWSTTDEKFIDLPPNGIRNLTIDDDFRFYGYDVQNLSASKEVAIGEIEASVWTILQLPEGV